MPLPGQHPVESRNPEIALRAKIAELEKRVATLERENRVPMVVGAPSNALGRDGQLAGQSDTPRLWLKINGTWRYTALT